MNGLTQPITRFAPSPTGMLHIGSARTALFAWLFAKHTGGQFKLRIEDTDKERSTPEAVAAIIDGLTWLELQWDGDIVYQSQRAARHAEVAQILLEAGHAYRCYASAQELAEMREQAKAEGRPVRYDGRWRDRPDSEAPPGVAPVIRLKAEHSGETVLDDLVQGQVVIPNATLDDFVLLRSDGSPTYMLSVVVDDYDMGISHVLRGDDHLTNAARQAQIFKAMGWPLPRFAHIPLIHGPDGAKLSKRHGALAVEAYRDMGYLAPALLNYLLRLGWSHGDDEIISIDQAVEWFSLDDVNRGPARFDFDKLNFINAHYLRRSDDGDLAREVIHRLEAAIGKPLLDAQERRIFRAVPDLKLRAKTLAELAEKARFLVAERPLTLTDKARALLAEQVRPTLHQVRNDLARVTDWSEDAVEVSLQQSAATLGLKFGKIAQPLRAALTGGADSPGLAQVITALDREETLARLDDQLSAMS